MSLITTPNLPDPDGFYQQLLEAHGGLSLDQSTAMNARLILILANHIGDGETLRNALRMARENAPEQ